MATVVFSEPIGSYGAVIAAGRASAGEGFAQRVFSGERRHGLPLSTMTKSNAITMHAATAAMTAPDVTKANGFNIGRTLTPTPSPDKRRSCRIALQTGGSGRHRR